MPKHTHQQLYNNQQGYNFGISNSIISCNEGRNKIYLNNLCYLDNKTYLTTTSLDKNEYRKNPKFM